MNPEIESIILSDIFKSRFWERVSRSSSEQCWFWTGGTVPLRGGYGYCSVSINGKQKKLYAHRVSFFLANDHWPKLACHTCDQPLCVNPMHLVDANHKWNMNDALTKGLVRVARGENAGNSRWKTEDIVAIREARRSGISIKKIARMFSSDSSNISRIVRGLTWSHLPGSVKGGIMASTTRFSDDQIRRIRMLASNGEKQSVIAASVGCSKSTVAAVLTGRIRRDVRLP